MKEKSAMAILGTLAAAFWIAGIYFFLQKDREAPRVLVSEASFIYEEGMEQALMLEGVSATDNADGEVSGKVIIEKIVPDEKEGTAVITYGVSDRSGNVGTASLKVEMLAQPEGQEASGGPEEGGPAQAALAGLEQGEASETGDKSDPGEDTQPNAEARREGADPEETAQNDGQREEPRNAGSQDAPAANAERPSIALKSGEATTAVGRDPAWVNVIESLQDDKDDYGALFGSLKVSGEYDKYTAGAYRVTLTVTDSDGNESNAAPLTIVVQ